MTKTDIIFQKHNNNIINSLIPKDNNMPYAFFTIDPQDVIFTKKLSDKC